MSKIKKTLFSILLTSVWINICEFVRNEFIVKKYWLNHFYKLGIEFPSTPINGVVWMIWSICLSISIYAIATKFSIVQTILLSWFSCFCMMWLVIGNLGVLPQGILIIALPLSLLEIIVATLITKKMLRYNKSIFLKNYILK